MNNSTSGSENEMLRVENLGVTFAMNKKKWGNEYLAQG